MHVKYESRLPAIMNMLSGGALWLRRAGFWNQFNVNSDPLLAGPGTPSLVSLRPRFLICKMG